MNIPWIDLLISPLVVRGRSRVYLMILWKMNVIGGCCGSVAAAGCHRRYFHPARGMKIQKSFEFNVYWMDSPLTTFISHVKS